MAESSRDSVTASENRHILMESSGGTLIVQPEAMHSAASAEDRIRQILASSDSLHRQVWLMMNIELDSRSAANAFVDNPKRQLVRLACRSGRADTN